MYKHQTCSARSQKVNETFTTCNIKKKQKKNQHNLDMQKTLEQINIFHHINDKSS